MTFVAAGVSAGAAGAGAAGAGAAGAGAAGAGAAGASSAGGSQILMKLLGSQAGKGSSSGVMGNISNTRASLLGAGIGIIQGLKARKAKKAADALMPPASDPTQLAFLAEMNQKRRSLNTGSAFAANMGYLKQAAAGTNQAIVQAGGGDVAGTMQALLGSQANIARGMNQVLGQADEQQKFYNTFASDLTNKIAQRRMELALSKSLQKRAEWAQYSQDAYANLTNAAARGMGVSDWADILKRKSTPNTPAPNVSAPLGTETDNPTGVSPASVPELGSELGSESPSMIA